MGIATIQMNMSVTIDSIAVMPSRWPMTSLTGRSQPNENPKSPR